MQGMKGVGESFRPSRIGVMRFLLALLALATFILPYQFAYAGTGAPKILNYQGRLMDSSGNLLGGTGTPYCFRFSL